MIPPATRLFRYVSFDQFLQIVFTNKISAVLPRKWDDGFEQYWLEYLKTSDGHNSLEKHVKKNLKYGEQYVTESIALLENLVNILYDTVYAICFTEAGDEELLWRAKNHDDKTIMICTSAGKISQIGNTTTKFGPEMERIRYDLEDHGSIDELLDKLGFAVGVAQLNNPYNLLLHKRKCFAYEKEVRLLYSPDDLSILKDSNGNQKDAVELDLPDGFIQGVMVYPAARDRHVKLIEEICDHFGLRFLGKSNLYNFRALG